MNMMQKMKKNNKGFTLVELIVVILIIGVLAVAIAPQVTKWVGRAGESQKTNEASTIQSAIQAAVAEYLSKDNASLNDNGHTVTIANTDSGLKITMTNNDDDLLNLIKEVIVDEPKNDRTATITSKGAVQVTK